jgi:CRP-like cAMP-binding protein
VIASGRVVFCTPDDDEPLEIELGAGSVVGELAMFVDMDHETTVTAKGEVIALRIPRAALQETLEKDPTLSEHFVDIMRARLEMMARRLRAADRMLGFLDREADRPSTGVH